jgi:hypothetical protein
MNSYFSQVAPYMQPINPQEQQGLMPVFQNMAAQQQNQNAALAQQNQLVQQAGQTQQGGMNPMSMAAMLRKKDPSKPANVYDKSQMMPDTPQYADPAYNQAGY